MRHPQQNAQALYEVAAAQGGYFTAAQAREAGYAYSQQHYHFSRGHWLRIDRGLFRLRDYPPGEREDLIRWSLWSRDQKGAPQAVVSHDTALTVHDLSDIMPERVHLPVPRGFRKRVPAGCILHFPFDLGTAEHMILTRCAVDLIGVFFLSATILLAIRRDHLSCPYFQMISASLDSGY